MVKSRIVWANLTTSNQKKVVSAFFINKYLSLQCRDCETFLIIIISVISRRSSMSGHTSPNQTKTNPLSFSLRYLLECQNTILCLFLGTFLVKDSFDSAGLQYFQPYELRDLHKLFWPKSCPFTLMWIQNENYYLLEFLKFPLELKVKLFLKRPLRPKYCFFLPIPTTGMAWIIQWFETLYQKVGPTTLWCSQWSSLQIFNNKTTWL